VKLRARFACLAAVAAIAILQLGGCADTPSTFYSVILSPKGPIYVAQNSTGTVINASVLNDAANGGVTFSISPSGIGTLTQTSSTSATYSAPATVSASTSVVVTAVAVDYPKSSSNLTINIEPPPVITTTSLPSGSVNEAYSAPVVATGGVPPLSWALASGSLPAGLALGSSTTDTVNITGKPTTNGPSTFTVKVTDAAGEVATSQSLTIVISTLAITTTSPLPSATFSTPPTPYSEQFAASGGTSPYTWSVASGSALPAGLSISSSGLLSGSPTVQGNFTFGITVADSEAPPAAVTQTFTLSISGPQNLPLLTGSYAFTFTGNNAGGTVTTAGEFVTDGNGNITSGEQDTNSVSATSPTNTPNLTGTYTAGTDGRGTITLSNAPGAPVYAFSIDATGSHGRLIEFDSTGTRGSGRIEKQSVTTCTVSGTASNTYAGNFTFGGSGYAIANSITNAGPLAFAGTFTATAPISPATQGSIGSGEDDADVATVPYSDPGGSLTGLYNSGTDATHCVFNIQPSFGDLTYSAYPVSANEAFLVEVDPVSAISPFVSTLDMKVQIGYPFLAQNVIGGTMAGGLSGQVLSGSSYLPDVEIAQLNPTAGGTFDFLLTDNLAGTITSNMATSGVAATPVSVTYSSDQYGRLQATNLISPISPVFYLVNSTEAFVLSISGNNQLPVIFGHLYGQSTPPTSFNTAYLNGTFVEGSVPPPSTAARNVSGFFALDGNGNITGTQDESTTSGNTQAESVVGTYNVLDGTNGTGSIALTQPAVFAGQYVIVSPTKFVMITSTAGDAHPILVVVGN
jgi:Putative Ig domain